MSPNSKKILKTLALTAGAVALARAVQKHTRNFHYAGKVALVTGGSRGLGLVLARKLMKSEALVAICARDRDEVNRALTQLQQFGNNAIGFVCDVRNSASVQKCVKQVLQKWGRIDLLFNVAGIIEVGPFEAMTHEDFYNSMDTNCWGALHTITEVVPGMKKQGWGRIVNVASLGGKRAIPHMLPYAASKFALVGLSTGLRTELVKDGILVTTVCPGLMRTGSPRNATFKGQHKKEFGWFSIGDSLPFLSISAETAGDKILKACQQGDAEAIISGTGNIAAFLQHMAPNLTAEVLTAVNALLPAMGGIEKKSAKGFESTSWISPSVLTKLGDEAAEKNNEMLH